MDRRASGPCFGHLDVGQRRRQHRAAQRAQLLVRTVLHSRTAAKHTSSCAPCTTSAPVATAGHHPVATTTFFAAHPPAASLSATTLAAVAPFAAASHLLPFRLHLDTLEQ